MGPLKILTYYFGFIKIQSLRRIVNLVLVEAGFWLSRIIRRPVVFGKPWAASIEPTTSCNLRCPECPTGMQNLARQKGNLSHGNFETILNKLSPELMHLTLYFQGEPMLNADFCEMISLARKQNVYVATSTNGHFLNENTSNQIVKSGLNHLIISLDGLDQDTYEKYRVNGDFQKVLYGIQSIVKVKKESGSQNPFIELQFLVMRHNEHQMQAMRDFSKHAGVDKLTFKTAQVYNTEAGNTIIPTIKKSSRYRQNPDGTFSVAKKIRNRCHRIWSSLVITWDGKVVPCCYDKNAGHQSGNLLDESLSAIWKNQQYSAFRREILRDRAGIDICRNCGE